MAKSAEKTPISAGAIARLVILLLGLINTVLVMYGIDTIPIADETINQLISVSWNVGAALWAWWKDNPVTKSSRGLHAAE
ncbi:phage holin [Bifidobacterium crudilactis]|uniref:phage holin n=1 Tax=Bifidobacterium crudilactis TaxID=327277 RepID=UPI0023576A5B|nr:phage holin [Bifidobacterium crudilactis]MCI2158281.1 phage holin [Bifidobacterium crudilactis]